MLQQYGEDNKNPVTDVDVQFNSFNQNLNFLMDVES